MRSRMPPDYGIPDDPDTGKMDAAYLRTCLGIRTPIGETPLPLPVAVRRAHYDMARSLSLLGAMGPTGMDATQLATVIVLALRDPEMELPKRNGEPAATATTSAPKQAEKKPATSDGDEVVVTVDGKDRPGHYMRRGPGGRLLVLVDGEERWFKPEDVRRPEKGETVDEPDEVNQEAEV